jgi:hypothetical protein
MAMRILERRRIRMDFFDSQFFGEHGWELLLFLFTRSPQQVTIDAASHGLRISPSNVMVMAKLLSAHGLVRQGDSISGWGDIPLWLTEDGLVQVESYLEQLQLGSLAA